MRKTCRIILASLLMITGVVICFAGGALCLTVVLLPIGLIVFLFGASVGAAGWNLLRNKSVWVPPSQETAYAQALLRKRNRRM
jgi:hypothetical protein